MNVESLFFDRDLSATLRAHMEKAKRGANQIPESEFTSGNLNAIATDLYSDFHVAPVELTEGAISVEAQEADIDRRRFSDIDHGFPGESPTLRGTRVTYNVPYVG